MSTYLPEVEEIYFAKTKEYFQEVMSSYSIGNYRSATVMLYSVGILATDANYAIRIGCE